MGVKKKVTVSWSGGKDSAFALFKILAQNDLEVVSLHTVLNADNRRVGLHGVHQDLIEKQAAALGIGLVKLYLDPSMDHAAYEKLMRGFYHDCSRSGIDGVVFGDIFLEDLKQYRLNILDHSGLEGIFPLWGLETGTMITDFINVGFKTIICAADKRHFDQTVPGKTIDHNFVDSLPAGVDACGENGEFHTFVYDGPVFRSPVVFTLGSTVERVYQYQVMQSDGSVSQAESVFLFKEIEQG